MFQVTLLIHIPPSWEFKKANPCTVFISMFAQRAARRELNEMTSRTLSPNSLSPASFLATQSEFLDLAFPLFSG